MIPKIIHYCWFGGNEKPEIVKKCIDSWKIFCPEWEICEWNENNFDVTSVPYMKEAYEQKKWAFVSDVARLLIIYKSGGVYLDTDVEVIAPIDEWIEDEAFYIFESNRNIATGLGFGAVKGHKSVKAMLDFYKEKHFIVNGKVKTIPCPRGNTESLINEYKDLNRNGCRQQLDDVKILSNNDYLLKAIHHGAATWVDGPKVEKIIYKETKLKTFLRDSKKFEFVDKYFGKKMGDIYTFFVYDFLEVGLMYYLKRLISKMKNRN